MGQNVPTLLNHTVHVIVCVVIAGLLIAAALHDVAFRTVPNWLSGVLLSTGLVAAGLNRDPLYSFASAAILFVVAALAWRRGLMGGGDVKLLAASGALLPIGGRIEFVLLVALCGGALALLYLLLQRLIRTTSRRTPRHLFGRIVKAERWRIARRGPLPYASAIAAAALLMVLGG